MKKLLLVLLTISITTSAFACQCQSNGNFTKEDIVKSLESFMYNKLNVNVNDVRDVELLDSKNFLTRKNKLNLLKVKLLDNWAYSCTKACTPYLNRKEKYSVTYLNDGKLCTVNLKVKMISKSDDDFEGFNSKVSQKFKPTCI